MPQSYLLESILSGSSEFVHQSVEVSPENQVRIIIENIRSGGSTSIELNSFYDNFDYYQDLKLKKANLEGKIKGGQRDAQGVSASRQELAMIKTQEKELKVNILELALTIEQVRNSDKISEIKTAFRSGKLDQIEQAIPDDYLLGQFNQCLEIDQQIEKVSGLLKDNANEFRVKAEVTNLNYSKEDRLEKSIFYFERGVKSAQVSKDKDFLATYQFKFGLFYYNNSKINNALPCFSQSLALFEELAEKDSVRYVEDQAEAINNIAAIHSRNHNYKEAMEYYDRAVNMLEGVLPQNTNNQYLVALAFVNKGNVLLKCNNYEDAITSFKQSLHRWEKLMEISPEFYKPRLANNYNSIAVAYKKNLNFDEAEKAYLKSIVLRRELAEIDPVKNELNFTITLTNIGAFYRTIGRNKEARESYEEAIVRQEKLLMRNPNVRKHLSESYNNMGVYYYHQKDNDRSKEFYNRAIEIREVLALENPMEYNPDLAKTLLNIAISFAKGGDFKTAREYFVKSLKLYSELAEENPDAFLPGLEVTHYNFAISLQYGGEVQLAKDHYEKSLSIIEPLFAQNSRAHTRRLAVTLTKMCTFYMDYFQPPKKEATVRMANRVLALCTPENQKKYGLQMEYSAALKLLEACGEGAAK